MAVLQESDVYAGAEVNGEPKPILNDFYAEEAPSELIAGYCREDSKQDNCQDSVIDASGPRLQIRKLCETGGSEAECGGVKPTQPIFNYWVRVPRRPGLG